MTDQQTPEITEADVQSLAQKLAQFNKTLTPGEFAALAAVVVSGVPQTGDVQGYVAPGSIENIGGNVGAASTDPQVTLVRNFLIPLYGKKTR